MSYERFRTRAGEPVGSYEIFHIAKMEATLSNDLWPRGPGWYWWMRIEGHHPETDPFGPFPDKACAMAHANRLWQRDQKELSNREGDR